MANDVNESARTGIGRTRLTLDDPRNLNTGTVRIRLRVVNRTRTREVETE